MLTKNELTSIPLKIRDIARSRARIEKMRSKLYSPHGFDSREKVQSSGTQNAELVDMVMDFEAKLRAEEEDVAVLKQQAVEIFQKLEPEAKQLMTMRYIGALSWGEIAGIMNYAAPTLFKKHRQIINELYPEEAKEDEDL